MATEFLLFSLVIMFLFPLFICHFFNFGQMELSYFNCIMLYITLMLLLVVY